MLLDRSFIAARIPHAGSMCLLDEVLIWDETHIECRAASHRAADNPLRSHGRLGAACGVEYAAQAMAVHGALVARRTSAPAAGYLASLRSISLDVARLDDIATDLFIGAQRLNGDNTSVLYEFSITSASRALLHGRAIVILDAALLARSTRVTSQ